MSILPDREITRLAREQGMIEPFEEGQVRGGAISYGLSSYGYDIRVADEFKVFTNVYSVIVDPKAFDPRSFVDIREEHCIIPPNSFALARTLEFFRIPNDVLVLCVGKSTYARCFRGDTRVALVDGTTPTLEDMAIRAERGERFWGYAVGAYGRIIVAELVAPRWIGRDALMAIELDNGAIIRCTPDHEFLLPDGQLLPAALLRPGASLMPLYRELIRGYESIYQPLNGHLIATHRLADEWNLRHGVYEAAEGMHRHHIDHNRTNNIPPNITRLPAADHVRHHNAQYYGERFDAEGHGELIRRALEHRSEDALWRANFARAQRQRAFEFWRADRYADARQKLRLTHKESWTAERRSDLSDRMRARFQNPQEREKQSERSYAAWTVDDGTRRSRQREIARDIRIRDDITETVVMMALAEAGTLRGAARILGVDRSVFRRFPQAVSRVLHPRNHKVAAIRRLRGEHDVWCLTVPEAGNFALAAGVFTRNCGILVNVTPLEPEWRGHLTLEISNTTPLPAKIYANEGIAQLLFFRGTGAPAVTYATRGGKYQDQQGVTLPRM
jgi:deoxycytidine triphosphate deaminase